MARGEFARRIVVAAPPARVWETVIDVQRVASWIGVVGSVEEEEPLARYRAVLEDTLGPFRLRAELAIAVEELVEPRRLVVRGEGRDRQVGSRLVMRAGITVLELADGAVIDLEAEYEVTGRVASLGDATIRRKAARIVDEFFASAEAQLGRVDAGVER
jgi:carbon monoxide dehydrogenase subunit G